MTANKLKANQVINLHTGKLSLLDIATKYRNINIFINLGTNFDYEFVIKIKSMGYLYLWLPISDLKEYKQQSKYLEMIIAQIQHHRQSTIIYSQTENQQIFEKIKKLI